MSISKQECLCKYCVLEKSQGREGEPGTAQAVKCNDTHTQVTTGFRGVLVKNCSKNIPSTPHTPLVNPQGGNERVLTCDKILCCTYMCVCPCALSTVFIHVYVHTYWPLHTNVHMYVHIRKVVFKFTKPLLIREYLVTQTYSEKQYTYIHVAVCTYTA